MHLGDPCIHCGLPFVQVAAGPCVQASGVAARVRNFVYWKNLLVEHEKKATEERQRLITLIEAEHAALLQIESQLDLAKIALAETVLYVSGAYEDAGEDRDICRTQALHWFATGKSTDGYFDLRLHYFGTKNYDRWRGQQSNHEYGCGPSHGSVVFSIGLRSEFRMQNRMLLETEKEACAYYLVNLATIQRTRKEAKVPA